MVSMRSTYQPLTPPTVAGLDFNASQEEVLQYDRLGQTACVHIPAYDTAYTGDVKLERSQVPETNDNSAQAFGLGIDNVSFSSGSSLLARQRPDSHSHPIVLRPGSPLTPRSVVEPDDEAQQTQSGQANGPPSSPYSAGIKTPRTKLKAISKKPKARRGERTGGPELAAPLSVLTKDLTDIPLRDIEAWVNRSVQDRLKEAEKRHGHVARPMNSFMLYRSAYAERCKHLYSKNNHQDVSAVCGASWHMEPPEIVDLYNGYAKTERTKHQIAHPGYKFSPGKKGRRRRDDDSDGDRSDSEGVTWSPNFSDAGYGHFHRPKRALSYTPSEQSSRDYFEQSFGLNDAAYSKSAWDPIHAARPLPMPMMRDHGNAHYVSPSMQSDLTIGTDAMLNIDLRMADGTTSMMPYTSSQDLLGLPGGNALSFMRPPHSPASSQLGDEHEVDPTLLTYNGLQHEALLPNPVQHHGTLTHAQMAGQMLQRHPFDNLAGEEYRPDAWQSDTVISPMAHETEFEKWGGSDAWQFAHA